MVLKRQTVWLLTMLSLIIVLSVYYITSPIPTDQLAYVGEEAEQNGSNFVEFEEVTGEELDEMFDDKILTSFTNDEVFNSIRLERQIARDRLSEDYVAVIASVDASADVQSRALDNIESLRVLAQKEEMLETLIKTKGYEDVLVIAEGDEVKIIVKANELSREDAVKINLMAREQLGMEKIAVAFQPTNK
ncbi:SpoIIIAH-like family protein [Anaerobacillus alkaliphilus]|uniref:SpoIIIAH-like family protein n=1 Tax=Anaerobacillus alkaliphilus TaxID=1548597 RepID=A0A4Q0VRI1_9BACI|nr:SpoIIIAH-like family protein [Anaerobacillus alkaliphilus]RXI99512.1 SpoIIIAH-like family protein [Anaerobacillus alkaliphilus]